MRMRTLLCVLVQLFFISSVKAQQTPQVVFTAAKLRQQTSESLVVHGKISPAKGVVTPCCVDSQGNFVTRVVKKNSVIQFRLHGGYEPLDIEIKDDFSVGTVNLRRLSFKRAKVKSFIDGNVKLENGISEKDVELCFSIVHEPTEGAMENYSCLRDWGSQKIKLSKDGSFRIPNTSTGCTYYVLLNGKGCQPIGKFVTAGSGEKLSFELEKRHIFTNEWGMEFVQIPAGKFIMGGSIHLGGEVLSDRWVEVKKPFYISTTHVTNEVVEKVYGNPQGTRDLPAGTIFRRPSEKNIINVFDLMSKMEKQEGGKFKYRIPTEEEWEFVARGGTFSGPFFVPEGQIDDYAVINTTDIAPVASRQANQYGVYDVFGNTSDIVMVSESPRVVILKGGHHFNLTKDLAAWGRMTSGSGGYRPGQAGQVYSLNRGFRLAFDELE